MVRFGSILIVYFVVGATMWGGGAITWDDAGIGNYIFDDPSSGDVSQEASDDLEASGGPIQQIAGTIGGGLIAAWNIMSKFIGFLFWPITVLLIADAPMEVVVLGGGSLTVAFMAAFIRTIRGSA